jgi:hypothetical protein
MFERRRTACGLLLPLLAVAFGLQAAYAAGQAEALDVLELNAGLRLLYELRLEKARAVRRVAAVLSGRPFGERLGSRQILL